jgi:hypothetical protein
LFRTNKHDIYTVEQNKKALSAHDDKQFILENGINFLAWCHYKIKVEKINLRTTKRACQAYKLINVVK